MYYFLPDDFQKLNKEIKKVNDRIAQIGKDMGASCQEGAETFHDNFAYEDGERQQYMLSTQLRKLIGIRNDSRIASVTPEPIVSIGKTVTVRDDHKVEHTYKIGSFMTFGNDESIISYNSPLARLIVGMKVGNQRTGKIGHSTQTLTVVAIT